VTASSGPAAVPLERIWDLLGIDPFAAGVQLVDPTHANALGAMPGTVPGAVLVAHVDTDPTVTAVREALGAAGDDEVTVLQRLGAPDQRVLVTTWDEVSAEPGTCLYVAAPSRDAERTDDAERSDDAERTGGALLRFHELVGTLRERCPWDRQQTHASLVPFLVEETFELVDALQALDADDPASYHAVVEELGDVLFQIEFHAVIGEQEGRFTIDDVATGIHDKLVRRHPHVFADVEAHDAATVVANWDAIKRAEKDRDSIFDGVAHSLPALAYTQQLMRKAAKVGFDWPDVSGPLAKLDEELNELRDAIAPPAGGTDRDAVADELGDVLATLVSVARHLGVDAEVALRAAAGKFRRRFEGIERLASERGIDVATADLTTLDALWDEVKTREPR
jgi:tetrapyrrole methylase family protein/MazG family protein